jgi:hypothetical protein
MTTFKVFYGSSARNAAIEYAEGHGKLHSEYFGEEKLSIDDSKRLLEDLQSPPIYEQRKMILVGPLDKARLHALDPLLKYTEAGDARYTEPVFWSTSLSGVNKPFLSRCEVVWTSGSEELSFAKDLSVALIDRNWSSLHKIFQENTGNEYELLSRVMSHSVDTSNSELGAALKKISRLSDLQTSEILSAIYKKL